MHNSVVYVDPVLQTLTQTQINWSPNQCYQLRVHSEHYSHFPNSLQWLNTRSKGAWLPSATKNKMEKIQCLIKRISQFTPKTLKSKNIVLIIRVKDHKSDSEMSPVPSPLITKFQPSPSTTFCSYLIMWLYRLTEKVKIAFRVKMSNGRYFWLMWHPL